MTGMCGDGCRQKEEANEGLRGRRANDGGSVNCMIIHLLLQKRVMILYFVGSMQTVLLPLCHVAGSEAWNCRGRGSRWARLIEAPTAAGVPG